MSFDNHRAEAIPEHRGQQESCNTCQPPSWTDADRDERVALRVRSSTYQSENCSTELMSTMPSSTFRPWGELIRGLDTASHWANLSGTAFTAGSLLSPVGPICGSESVVQP